MSEKLILERYRPIGQIGEGGFASVILAWDIRLQRRVAIKRMELDGETAAMVEGSDEISAYELGSIPGLAEARTAAMLQDPNIAGVIDFRVSDGFAYFIMEYVDGVTLRDLLDDYPDLITLDVVAAVFAGVAHALEVAHSNQVLHLDIKPANIIINHQGEVKVTDFGLAELSSASGYSRASGGTIGYMPLEQMRLEGLDARCDEWALASVVYEMLTGSNPFLADDLAGAQIAIEQADILLPSICRPELDEEADDVIFYALDPEKSERYDSVQDFAEELQPFLGSVRRGTRQLAHLVGEASNDSEEEKRDEGGFPMASKSGGGFGLGFIGRIGDMLGSDKLMRAWGAIGCGLVSYLALFGNVWLDGLSVFVRPIAFAVVCILSFAVPHVGALLSMLALAAAFASHSAFFCAAIAAVGGIAWWAVLGRRGVEEPVTMLIPASFGAFGCAGVAPLASGLNLCAKDAVANTIGALCLAVSLGTLGASTISGWDALSVLPTAASRFTGCDQVLLSMVGDLSFWVGVASWLLAAPVVAAISGEGGMIRRSFALVFGVAILFIALVVQAYLASSGTTIVPSVNDLFILAAVAAISFAYSIARAR